MKSGLQNLFWGAVIISIGLANGSSVFLGNPYSILDWIFDGLGTLWILQGLYQMATNAGEEDEGPPPIPGA